MSVVLKPAAFIEKLPINLLWTNYKGKSQSLHKNGYYFAYSTQMKCNYQ